MHPDTRKMGDFLLTSGEAKTTEEAFEISYQACKLVSTCLRLEMTTMDARRFLEEADFGAKGLEFADCIALENGIPPLEALGIAFAAVSLSNDCKKWNWESEKIDKFLDEVADSIQMVEK